MSSTRRALALVLALVFAALVAMEAGLWIRTETYGGPFLGETGNPTVFLKVGQGWLAQCCIGARTDVATEPERSKLRLRVGGIEYPHAHAGHDVIRAGAPGAYSHWVNELRLSLPEGQSNDAKTAVVVTYPVQILGRDGSYALIGATAFALALALGRALYPGAILATVRRHRRIALVLLALAAAATLALEAGIWRRTEVVPGPFATDAFSGALVVPVDQDHQPSPLFGARGDDDDATMRSGLKLSVMGQAYVKEHDDHGSIGRGEPGAYSHWLGEVFFALPPGVANGWDTRVTLVYPLRLVSPWLTAAILTALGGLWLLVERPRLTPNRVARLTRWPFFMMSGLAWILAALTVADALATAVAWAGGWALPSTAPIVGSRLGRWFAMAEPHGPELVLSLSALGALAGWGARSRGVAQGADEARLLRLLGAVGLPILFATLLLASSAQWSGFWRQGDFSFVSIAGLVPFSDADAYYGDANDVVNSGFFGPVGARRPLAQAFRSTLLALGGYDYATMVVIQTLLVAVAIFVASQSVARWRGPWAGTAFAAMAVAVGREFLSTALTEPLGLFWGLCAVPPLVGALRRRSARHAVLATALLIVALFNRMGSMFTIPALLVWCVACFGTTKGAKLRIAAAALAALAGVVALNAVTAEVYTRDAELSGSNFAYTLCGLTIGGGWSECEQRYKGELSPSDHSESAMVRLMYRKAFENFAARPSVSFRRLADGCYRFAKTLPGVLTQGYFPVSQLFPAGLPILEIIAAIGLLCFVPRMPRHEKAFWLLFWSSAVLSAGVVYFDDGRRVMIAVYPVASLFFVGGLRTVESSDTAAIRRFTPARRAEAAGYAAAALLLACVATPWLVHRFFRPSEYGPPSVSSAPGPDRVPSERFIFGGSRMTGMLVLADGEPLRRDVPTLHVSDFVRIVRQSGVEADQLLVTPEPPPVPFGFIASPDFVSGEQTRYDYIVPPDVLTRKNVQAWRLVTAGLPRNPGSENYWLRVTDATPVLPVPGAHSEDAMK